MSMDNCRLYGDALTYGTLSSNPDTSDGDKVTTDCAAVSMTSKEDPDFSPGLKDSGRQSAPPDTLPSPNVCHRPKRSVVAPTFVCKLACSAEGLKHTLLVFQSMVKMYGAKRLRCK